MAFGNQRSILSNKAAPPLELAYQSLPRSIPWLIGVMVWLLCMQVYRIPRCGA